MDWFYRAHEHPRPDLVLLQASWLYTALFGSLPTPHERTVNAPMHGPATRFESYSPASMQNPNGLVARRAQNLRRVSEIVLLESKWGTQSKSARLRQPASQLQGA